MKLSLLVIAVTGIALSIVYENEAYFFGLFRKKPRCLTKTFERPYPYYFGSTNLACLTLQKVKGKRSVAPSRFPLAITHRFIYYEGWYFEFGLGKNHITVYGKTAYGSDKCSSGKESSPAGYSAISVECLKRCTDKYKAKYGGYNLFTHNCHVFANRMSDILCNAYTCPTWCN